MWGSTRVSGGGRLRPRSANTGMRVYISMVSNDFDSTRKQVNKLSWMKISVPLWLEWKCRFHFDLTEISRDILLQLFFCGFLKFVIKMIMRQRSILHESVKEKILIFHLEKGMFPFIVTVNYHICSILLCLNSIDVEFFMSCIRKKNNQTFWYLFLIFFLHSNTHQYSSLPW